MSRLPPVPDPLECVLFDAGDTLLAPTPSFEGRFVAVAAEHGLDLEEVRVDAAVTGDADGAHRVQTLDELFELLDGG